MGQGVRGGRRRKMVDFEELTYMIAGPNPKSSRAGQGRVAVQIQRQCAYRIPLCLGDQYFFFKWLNEAHSYYGG